MIKKLRCISYGIAMALITTCQLNAQVQGDPHLDVIPAPIIQLDKSPTKLNATLIHLYENYGAANAAGRSKPTIPTVEDMPLTKYMLIKGDQVLVDVTVDEFNPETRAELEKMGMTINANFGRVVSGMVNINSLPSFESAGRVRFVRPSLRRRKGITPANINRSASPNVVPKPIISQGDTALGSYLARNKYGLTGKGVKVGILSDSYDNLGTADIGVRNGELPGLENPFGYKKPVKVLLDLDDSSGIDEGRAMAEIVHDIAPGAELAFYSAYYGEASFADGIVKLAKKGCQVIVDDIAYLTEPFYQDGIIAQAVDKAKKLGAAYFTAAGNEGANTYDGEYHKSTYAPYGIANGTAHNFSAPGATPRYTQPVFIPRGGSFVTAFQWDQPAYSAGGAANIADLDIYLLNSAGQIVAAGYEDNLLSGDPTEYMGYYNGTTSNTFFVLILDYAGVNVNRVKCVNFGDQLYYNTLPVIPGSSGPTIFGHSNAAGAITTGAAYYLQTPRYGSDTAKIEYFSAVGGIGILFNGKGKRVFSGLRLKPEFTSVDGGNTSFFPPYARQDTRDDSDTFPNFFGTSAAAPHAAGVAALMIDAQKLNTITPDEIKGIMSTNTSDMGSPYFAGFEKGFDFATGTGLLKAEAAIAAVKYPNIYIKDLVLKPACSDNPAIVRNWVITNPNPFEVEAHWLINAFAQQGTLMAAPGETMFSTQTVYLLGRPVANIAILDWYDNLGLPNFDLKASTTAKCGVEAITAANTDKLSDMAVNAETINNSRAVSVYPNPISKSFRVTLSLNNQEKAELSLYTLDGRLLLKRVTGSTGVVDIDASSYAPGMYILKVKQQNFDKSFKLIKK